MCCIIEKKLQLIEVLAINCEIILHPAYLKFTLNCNHETEILSAFKLQQVTYTGTANLLGNNGLFLNPAHTEQH